METVDNLHVGRADVKPSAPAHTRGVREGNRGARMIREPGIKRVGRLMARATSRRSTGINPEAHHPIDPRMPVLTPA
jgi:hypothetical protein